MLFNMKEISSTELLTSILECYPGIHIDYAKDIRDGFYNKGYRIFKPKKDTASFLGRITIPLFMTVWLLLLICMPLFFIATGSWGYSDKYFGWFLRWGSFAGIKNI